jgi:hypothetical protein
MMKLYYPITLAVSAAVIDLPSYPNALPELNATKSYQNETLMLSGDPNESKFSSSFHLSLALSGSLLLIFRQLRILHCGYTLSFSIKYSTDVWMWVSMGFIIIPWKNKELSNAYDQYLGTLGVNCLST